MELFCGLDVRTYHVGPRSIPLQFIISDTILFLRNIRVLKSGEFPNWHSFVYVNCIKDLLSGTRSLPAQLKHRHDEFDFLSFAILAVSGVQFRGVSSRNRTVLWPE